MFYVDTLVNNQQGGIKKKKKTWEGREGKGRIKQKVERWNKLEKCQRVLEQ